MLGRALGADYRPVPLVGMAEPVFYQSSNDDLWARVGRRGGKASPCAGLAAGFRVARLRLDRAEHASRIKRVGRLHPRSSLA
jgi:hypothetical protein